MPLYEYKCQNCGRVIELLVSPRDRNTDPHCSACNSTDLKKLISRPGHIRVKNNDNAGQLHPVDPRKAVEHLSRTYDSTDVDPGAGFREVAKRAAAGDHPNELKEAIKEIRSKEAGSGGEK